MPDRPVDLPIADVLPDVVAAVDADGAAVVEAPPGAGKTTRVPPALLDTVAGRVVVLEPRRVAARAAAARMASELGGRLGGRVGLTTADERQVSRDTRIEVVTEGVLVRRLQADPTLPGIGAVVLDEFHERSVDADLALAFGWEVRTALRDDLAVLVMSATLDGARVAALLDDAPVVRSDGRLHPVEVVHRDRDPVAPLAPDVADAVEGALADHDGDVLVFLPGVGEIRRVQRALSTPGHVDVRPLHGSLPPQEQDAALRPTPPGRRTVVLATDLAESSVTVPGVTVVVDAGLSREPRLDPRTGMTRLVTTRASRAAADQRAGRAGRLRPGVAIRLWSREDHQRRDAHPRPEILQTDLAAFVLQVSAWGATIDDLALLDRPPAESVTAAEELLTRLGVLDAPGRVTAHGREVAALPAHPRLAHLLLRGRELGAGRTAARLAALLGERDVLAVDREAPDADLATRVRVVAGGRPPPGASVRRGTLGRVRRRADRLGRAAGLRGDDHETLTDPADAVGVLAATGFPDRVAARRAGRGRFVLANGRGVTVDDRDPLADAELLVATDVDDRGRDGRLWTGAATTIADLQAHAPDLVETTDEVVWDDDRGDVVARRRTHVGAATLREDPLPDVSLADAQSALLEGVRRQGLQLLPWDGDTRRFRARAAFVGTTPRGAGWPSMDEDDLLAHLDQWLAPFLGTARRRGDLARVPLQQALSQRLGWDRAGALDDLAPTHLPVPSGRSVRVDYEDPHGPVLAVKLQEMFGATATPTVAGVPVVVHLLSPAGRPLQVTTDLPAFWAGAYAEVRAEMRGRYPKHPWPEDPTTATPTARTTRRR
jgi:ATP-dependent helicase HrpB